MANSVNRYFEGLLVGSTLGFLAGLLTAPKRGSELRRELADSADDMLKQANGNFAELKDRMNQRIQPLADKAGIYKDEISSKASEMKSRMAEKTKDLREKVSERTATLAEKASELRHQAKRKVGRDERESRQE